MLLQSVITILIVLFSIILHEVAHGYAANALGDPTARLSGRLTLNPLPHLDLFGSVLVTLLSWFSGGFIFGWAKPVPYNPYNLKAGRWSESSVAAAGPATNLLLALIFGLSIRFFGNTLPAGVLSVAGMITAVNCALMVFNLIPIPPLDGSKILMALLPPGAAARYATFSRYGFVLVILIVFFAWQFIAPLITGLFSLITGVGF
jgi:Zn-dependent protease